MKSFYGNGSRVLKLIELISMDTSGIKHSALQRLSPDVPFSKTRKRLTAPIVSV